MLTLKAVYKQAKPFRLMVFWVRNKVQVFTVLLNEAIQSAHAYGEDIKIMEDFTCFGTIMQNNSSNFYEFGQYKYRTFSVPVQKDYDLDFQIISAPCHTLWWRDLNTKVTGKRE